MSAFLGPIHYWLFNKIKIQNSLTEEIISYAKANTRKGNLKDEMDVMFGTVSISPLEDVIDTTNIHGWLQECVSTVEYRLAFSVTALIKEKEEVINDLKTIFFNYGVSLAKGLQDISAGKIYQQLNDTLLDGMPCDHANGIVSQEENEITWKRNVCVHKQYWSEVGGDIKNYYILREEFIKGFVKDSGLVFKKLDDVTFSLTKAE
jgi:hypothetical protein